MSYTLVGLLKGCFGETQSIRRTGQVIGESLIWLIAWQPLCKSGIIRTAFDGKMSNVENDLGRMKPRP